MNTIIALASIAASIIFPSPATPEPTPEPKPITYPVFPSNLEDANRMCFDTYPLDSPDVDACLRIAYSMELNTINA